MSRRSHNGTTAGLRKVEDTSRPFVIEQWNPRSFTFSPLKGRFSSLEEAVQRAKVLGTKIQIVTFDQKTSKPKIVWAS